MLLWPSLSLSHSGKNTQIEETKSGGGGGARGEFFTVRYTHLANLQKHPPEGGTVGYKVCTYLAALQEHPGLHLGELAGGVRGLSVRSVRSHVAKKVLRGLGGRVVKKKQRDT